MCCQNSNGGMLDKPTKYPDYYHTCYSLAGLGISQNKSQYEKLYVEKDYDEVPLDQKVLISKNKANIIKKVNPIYNLLYHKVDLAKEYFKVHNKS